MNVETDESLRRFDDMATDIIKALDRLTAAVERQTETIKEVARFAGDWGGEVLRDNNAGIVLAEAHFPTKPKPEPASKPRTCGECAEFTLLPEGSGCGCLIIDHEDREEDDDARHCDDFKPKEG